MPDDLGVDDDTAARDDVEGVHEVGDPADAVLEEIAGTAAARPVRGLGDQFGRVGVTEILRQHQDADVRMFGADRQCGPQTVVEVARRHSHIGDHDVGAVVGDGLQ